MKVLDLQCEHAHVFEGWFGSEDDFCAQLERGLVSCPMCGSAHVSKKPSAPRLNLGATRDAAEAAAPAGPGQPVAGGQGLPADLQAAWLAMARRVLAETEDVGRRFAEEARRMHYGEVAQRGIRGQASREETEALLDEGISVMPLPLPESLKNGLQ